LNQFQLGLDPKEHLTSEEVSLRAMGLTLQPHVIVSYENLDKFETVRSAAYAVIQSNLYYEMASVLAAVESCFKTTLVMNVSYPAAAKSSWIFVQTGIFDISTKHDDMRSKVLELSTQIKGD
jgi:hypothetical protein